MLLQTLDHSGTDYIQFYDEPHRFWGQSSILVCSVYMMTFLV